MRHSSRSTLLAATVAALSGVTAAPALADVVFADTEFSDSVWVLETVQLNAGGSASAAQSLGTGNPGNARRVTLSPNSGGTIWGFSRYGNTGATHIKNNNVIPVGTANLSKNGSPTTS